MDDPAFRNRLLQLLHEEASSPFHWWYISLAGDDGFLGATIVPARGVTGAPPTRKLRMPDRVGVSVRSEHLAIHRARVGSRSFAIRPQ